MTQVRQCMKESLEGTRTFRSPYSLCEKKCVHAVTNFLMFTISEKLGRPEIISIPTRDPKYNDITKVLLLRKTMHFMPDIYAKFLLLKPEMLLSKVNNAKLLVYTVTLVNVNEFQKKELSYSNCTILLDR